jgi:hypothetical protein
MDNQNHKPDNGQHEPEAENSLWDTLDTAARALGSCSTPVELYKVTMSLLQFGILVAQIQYTNTVEERMSKRAVRKPTASIIKAGLRSAAELFANVMFRAVHLAGYDMSELVYDEIKLPKKLNPEENCR